MTPACIELAARVTQYRLAIESAARHLESSECDDRHCRAARASLHIVLAPGPAQEERQLKPGLHLQPDPVKAIGALAKARPAPALADSDLTEREREVLVALATGATYDQIMLMVFMSRSTLKNTIRALYPKLGARSRDDAVAVALMRRWVLIE